MPHYFIYAKDYSASTSHEKYYHENGLKTLVEFKSDVNDILKMLPVNEDYKIIYLHWGHECVEVDEETAVDTYKRRYALGDDTLPETIIQWIANNIDGQRKIKLMYLITDGLIKTDSINKCFELNKNIDYEKVVFHAFNKNIHEIDLSVAASFLKSSCVVYRNTILEDETNVAHEYNYDLFTIDNFTTEIEKLRSYIKLKYINTLIENQVALDEIDKIKKMRDRLFKDLAKRVTAGDNNLNSNDKDYIIRAFKHSHWYTNLINESTYNLKTDIEKSINALINYIVNKKKSYDFDALKFDKSFGRLAEESVDDFQFNDYEEIEFPDIILADDIGVPVIILTPVDLLDKYIFKSPSVNFSKFRSIADCPLPLLNDADFKDSFGYFYTLKVFKQLLEKTNKTEPRTRRPYRGGIVIEIDTYEYDNYNDYVIAATYFNYKNINFNIGLFYYVLWKICESKEWMDRNVVEHFRKYMLRRVTDTNCKIGLSSLPLDPQAVVSLPTALWYCVELSSEIFKDDPKHFMHERLRMYYGSAHAMIEILQHLDYDINIKAIEKRLDIIRHSNILKRIPQTRDKVFYLLGNIFKNKNGFLVSEIENARNIKKINYLKLDHKGMLSDEVIEEKTDLVSYLNFLHYLDGDVKIFNKTFRPYFMIDGETTFYTILYKNARQIIHTEVKDDMQLNYKNLDELDFTKIVSYHKLYLNCVQELQEYPSLQKYSEYVLKKRKFCKNIINIFPLNVNETIEKVYNDYNALKEKVTVIDFIKISKKYTNRIDRIKIENIREFDSDVEILEFLNKEEKKCNVRNVLKQKV